MKSAMENGMPTRQQPDQRHKKAQGHQWVFDTMRKSPTRRRTSAGQ